MAVDNKKEIEAFLSACDELVNCKFLIAESKIQKILDTLAEAPPVYQLVSECMEQFNHDRELSKAFVQDAKGNYFCQMPVEEFKIIALMFTILVDINDKKLDFGDFVKRFYNDKATEMTAFQLFIEKSFLPFRNLIAEAFGYPALSLTPVFTPKEEAEGDDLLYANEEVEKKILHFPSARNLSHGDEGGLNELCQSSQRIACQILDELEQMNKKEELVEEIKSICYAILMAAADTDLDILRGLTLGLRYASKGVKPIKFLVKELDENVTRFFLSYINSDD